MWKRSSFCKADQPMCVEVEHRLGVGIFVRDSKSDREPFVFDEDEWSAFIAGVKNGEFD